MQLLCFQLSYDGVAEIRIWCRSPMGEGCSWACQPGPATHQLCHPRPIKQGRSELCARQVLYPWRDTELDLALSLIYTVLTLSTRSAAGVGMGRIFSGRQ